MATVQFRGATLKLTGELPTVGNEAPPMELVAPDLTEVALEDFDGRRIVVATVHSIDAPEGAQAVRNLHRALHERTDVALVVVTADSPFTLRRFQAFEGVEGAALLSSIGSTFGARWGVLVDEAPLRGHLARAWFVLDVEGAVRFAALLPDVAGEEPLDPLLAALG